MRLIPPQNAEAHPKQPVILISRLDGATLPHTTDVPASVRSHLVWLHAVGRHQIVCRCTHDAPEDVGL